MQYTAVNVPRAYEAMLWQMKIHAKREETRLGPAMVVPEPVQLTILRPMERVLFDNTRDANPFFHLMESIWMLAGANRVNWLLNFNSRYTEYADQGVVQGAYGYRWRNNFSKDQIQEVAQMLRKDPTTRRAVIAMWDPDYDLIPGYHDYPCNTHIYFRVVHDCLDMTVCNRSNDFFWGMMGANCVHLTILHEVIARASGIPMGRYHVFTNNLHVYEGMPRFKELWNSVPDKDVYGRKTEAIPIEIEPTHNSLYSFLCQCEMFVYGNTSNLTHPWLREIALPMYWAYMDRKSKIGDGINHIHHMPHNSDWQKAALEWIQRRMSSSSTLMEPSPSMTTGTIS